MTSTGEQFDEKRFWTSGQVRRAIIIQAFLSLFLAAAAGFGTYWYTSYEDVAKRMDSRLTNYQESQSLWIELSKNIYSNANPRLSPNPHLPSIEDVKKIQDATTSLIAQLNSVPTPNKKIEREAMNYRRKLNDIILEIGRYDETAESTLKIIRASNEAAAAGEKHRHEVERYMGSAIKRLWGSL